MPAFRPTVKHAMLNKNTIGIMPDVTFSIALRSYTLRCAEGQEEDLRQAASMLDERVHLLAKSSGAADDRQLLVMAALQLLDALSKAEAEAAETAALRAWADGIAMRLDELAASLDPLVTGDEGA